LKDVEPLAGQNRRQHQLELPLRAVVGKHRAKGLVLRAVAAQALERLRQRDGLALEPIVLGDELASRSESDDEARSA